MTTQQTLACSRIPAAAIFTVCFAEMFLTGIAGYIAIQWIGRGYDLSSPELVSKLVLEVMLSNPELIVVGILLPIIIFILIIGLYKRFYKFTVMFAATPLYLLYFLFPLLLWMGLVTYFLGDPMPGGPAEHFIHGLIVAMMLLALPALILTVLTTMILGVRLGPAYIYLDLSVEPAPPGSHTIYQSPWQKDLKSRIRSVLNHSIVYESPEVISRIIDWIRDVDQTRHGISNTLEQGRGDTHG